MDTTWRTAVWGQFGAAIDMLENAMSACPEDLWSDGSKQPEFWYLVYFCCTTCGMSSTGRRS